MKSTQTIFKSLIITLLVVIGFGFIHHSALAYNTDDKAIDAAFVSNHIGELRDISAEAIRNLTNLRTTLNLIQYAKYKIFNAPNATAQQKADANAALEAATKDVTYAANAQVAILKDLQNGEALLKPLVQEPTNTSTTNCNTSLGIRGVTRDPDFPGEDMQVCSRVFVSDYLIPANQQFDFTQKDIKPYLDAENAILAQLNLKLDQSDTVAAKAQAKKQVPLSALESCFTVSSGVNIGVCFREGAGWLVYLIITILSGLLWIGGVALDTAFNITVLNITTNLNSIQSIGSIWIIFRDLANLSFIFILLYVSITTILQVNPVNAPRTLARIVLAAILINFSLFIAKSIIDISNIFTIAFYNKFVPQDSLLSSTLMQSLGVANMFSSEGVDMVQQWGQSWAALIASGMGMIAVIFTAAFSFLTMAWLFIIRFVIIIFILVLSPLAFASYVLPSTSQYLKRWWNMVVSQVMFPPVYMLLIGVVLTIASGTGVGFLNTISDPTNAFDTSLPTGMIGGNSAVNFTASAAFAAMSVFLRYIIMIALILGATAIAKTQASKAGKFATSAIKYGTDKVERLRKNTRGLAQGYAGRAAVRARIPLVPKDYSSIKNLDKKLKNTWVGNTYYGKLAREKTTGALVENKFGSGWSVKTWDDEQEKIAKAQGALVMKKKRDATVADGNKPTATTAQREAMIRTLNQMSDKDLDNVKPDLLAKPDVARQLTAKQILAIEKSEKFTDTEKQAIKDMRYGNIITEVNAVNAGTKPAVDAPIKKRIGNLTEKELDLIGRDVVLSSGFISSMKSSQIENMLKSENYTDREKDDVRTFRKAPLMAAIATAASASAAPGSTEAAAIKTALVGLGPNEVSKLDDATLTNPYVMDQLAANDLVKIGQEKDSPILSAIGKYVRTESPVTPGSYLAKYGTDHPANKYVSTGQGQALFQ